MRIEIGQFEYTECWDGVLYKKLSDYPNITKWEIQNILDFINYEADNGRNCDIITEENIIIASLFKEFSLINAFTFLGIGLNAL